MATKRKTDTLGALRMRLMEFRDDRERAKNIAASVKKTQPELVDAVREADPDDNGIVYDPDDESKGAAYVQQNDPSEFWDEEAIQDYLRKHKATWMQCSTRVLDMGKWEANIANGTIPAKVAKRFKKTGDEPTPFIRFGKIKDESLQ